MNPSALRIAFAGCLALLAASANSGEPVAQAPAQATAPATPAPIQSDPELEPQITITHHEGEKVEEARVNGRLVWVRVTPAHGIPYLLIPDRDGYAFIRRDGIETGLKVPLWILFSF